ncbi:RNA polymerase subunit sigma, partial [Betaproteobacteria bacterium PRO5]|nr:RNA polymerase subunit sigma [Betaproteobacteria bacterium PRO5]
MSSSDSPVFTALYKQYQSQLISRITRLVGCRETAADLAQE